MSGLGAVGYSDHTPLVEPGARAVGRGASILEKHFTDDTSRPGPDHAASLNPADFAAYVEAAARRHLGDPLARDGEKALLDCERDVRHVSRQSVALVGDRPAGHTLTRDDLTTRRPGTGIEPHELDGLIGHVLATDVEGGRLLTGEHLRPAATIEAA